MTTTFSHSNRSLSEETARPTLGQSPTAHSHRCSVVPEVLGRLGIEEVSWLQWLPSRGLTYPTLGKGKSSSKGPFLGDVLVPWRVIEPDIFQLWEHPIFLIIFDRFRLFGMEHWEESGRNYVRWSRGTMLGRTFMFRLVRRNPTLEQISKHLWFYQNQDKTADCPWLYYLLYLEIQCWNYRNDAWDMVSRFIYLMSLLSW